MVKSKSTKDILFRLLEVKKQTYLPMYYFLRSSDWVQNKSFRIYYPQLWLSSDDLLWNDVYNSVVDPKWFFSDPDPVPDPTLKFISDPDPDPDST